MFDHNATDQSNPQGLLTLLRDEHQRMDWMLHLYRQQANIGLDAKERQRLIHRIERRLRALIVIKETILYPLVESKIDRTIMTALRSDHNILRERLVAMSKEMPDTLAMDCTMNELTLHVREHFQVEERRVFPAAQTLDSADLDTRCAKHRQQLLNLSHA